MARLSKAMRALGLLPILSAATALAQQAPPTSQPSVPWQGVGPHMWGDGYGGWPMFWGGPFMMIVTLIAFVWAMRLLFGHARWRDEFRHGTRGDALERMGHDANVSALRILNERFARGEIQKDEYEDKKAALLK